MSGIQAEWRLSELDIDSDDPFDRLILTTGLSVDLRGSEYDIHRAITRTLFIEGELDARGVTCALKDGGQDCRTCTQFECEPSIIDLCHLGRDQRLLGATAHERSQERNQPYIVLAESFGSYAAHGAAYEGLLAAAGA